jgi:hypothetical protein
MQTSSIRRRAFSARFRSTHDGVLDEELLLEVIANLVGGHDGGGKPIGETRRHDLSKDATAWHACNRRNRLEDA